jgi:hypothetical protein
LAVALTMPLTGAILAGSTRRHGPGDTAYARAGSPPRKGEEAMALARVVMFEGVDRDRIEQLRQQIETGERPEGLNATEIIVLHDPSTNASLTVVFFDNEDDYAQGNAILDAMPREDTPGERTSVSKYDVAIRASM